MAVVGDGVSEVCHNIDRVVQPVPARSPGGDCFACAMTAGARFLYPERTIDLDEVWDMFVVEYHDGRAQPNLAKLRTAVDQLIAGTLSMDDLKRIHAEVSNEKASTTTCNTWSGFRDVLYKMSSAFGRLEITWDMVEPRFDSHSGHPPWSFAWRVQDLSIDYTRRLEGWLRGGWVAWTEIAMHGGGPYTVKPDGSVWANSIDHFILIDGVRQRYIEERDADGAFKYGRYVDEIHVVDSSSLNLTGWHEVMQFTRKHGASSWWLARRYSR